MYGIFAEQLYEDGWLPIPLRGKRPHIPRWQTYAREKLFYSEVIRWAMMFPTANIGMPLGGESRVIAIDFDIDDVSIYYEIGEMVEHFLGKTPFIRVGQWPRQVRLYRADEVATARLGQLEILSQGTQVVLYGVHPDTDRHYEWIDAEPFFNPVTHVPEIDRKNVSALILALGKRVGPARNVSHGTITDTQGFDQLRHQRIGFRGIRLHQALKKQLREARPGALHNTMVSVVSVMASRGSSEERIRAFIDKNFSAPTVGPYAAVWDQVDEAITTAIAKFGKRKAA